MALNLNWRYYRINKEFVRQILEDVRYHVYKDQETRINWLDEFDMAPERNTKVEISDEFLNSVIANLYDLVKQQSEFEGATDC